jgi:hypothetical protein
MERLEAESSPDRGMIYVPNMPHASKPVSVGWQFSTVMLLPDQPSSWVGGLDQCRIGTEQSAIGVGIEQLRALLPQIKRQVIVLADRWYAVARFVCACRELGCSALIRLKRNRKLYRRAPPRKEKQRGAPCKHGPLFQGTRPETYGAAEASWEGSDEHGKRVLVSCWKQLHFREAPEAEVCVIRVQREAARESKRDPRESWFIWTGSQEVPLEQVRAWYRKRFSQEHGYRFLKQDLLWQEAHLRTPQQVERWSWLLACACNHLLLSKQLGLALQRPWESKRRPVTPQQVRRMMPSILRACWHTGSSAQTTRKIARLARRSAKNTGPTLCGGTQTQTGAKNAAQTGLSASTVLSFVTHSDSLDLSSELSARWFLSHGATSKQ